MKLIGVPKKCETLHGCAFALMEPSFGLNPDLPTLHGYCAVHVKTKKNVLLGSGIRLK